MSESDRPLVRLPSALLAHYNWQEDQEDRVRLHTTHVDAHSAMLFQIAIPLVLHPFMPGSVYEYTGSDLPRPGPQAHGLRLQLLGLAARMAKPTFDLMLAGYYGDGAVLARTMLECWGRAVYVRLRPCEFGRWYSPPDEMPEPDRVKWGYGKPEPAFGSEIEEAIKRDGSRRDRRIMADARIRYGLMSELGHPSGQAIDQTRSRADDKLLLCPDYSAELWQFGINHALFSVLCLLSEIPLIGQQSEDWHRSAERLDYLFDPMRDAMAPMIAEERAKAQAVKEANERKQRDKEERGKAGLADIARSFVDALQPRPS